MLGVAVDSNNNVFIAGTHHYGAPNYWDTIVFKFDSNLNTLKQKTFYSVYSEYFNTVHVDDQDNVICVGNTYAEGGGAPTYSNAIIFKFDNNLNALARKTFGGGYNDICNGVAVDSLGNIFAVGYTNSEGLGSYESFIVKFDSSLNILAQKRYGGTGDDTFYGIAIDSLDNIYCVGYTESEGVGGWEALVVKFDTNLNILAKKRYGGSGSDQFIRVVIDSLSNIYCCGNTFSVGDGSSNAIIIKFDSNLNILVEKLYTSIGEDVFYDVTIDSLDNVICAGHTTPGTYKDALIVKFKDTIPSGIITGSVITNCNFDDIRGLTLATSNLTLANSVMTTANSALAVIDTTAFAAINSNLTQTKDEF